LEGASEEDKIIQILAQIETIHESIPLSFFHGFIKERSTSPAFRLHFFLNAYQTGILIKESKESEVKEVIDFLTLLHSAFLHPNWQALFPSYVTGLLKSKNPLDLLATAFEIKAHSDFVHENAMRDSMGTHVRLVGREDKVHGFYLTKARSFDSVLQSIRFLRSELESDLFAKIFKTELDALSFLNCEQERKFLFLYGLRILAQE
jgi:hypothetical protein